MSIEKSLRKDLLEKTNEELEPIIGYSLSIDKQLFLKDLINAVRVRKKSVVSWKEQSFIYGSLLGDAYINKYGAITFSQGWKQKGFCTWKFLMLKQWNVLTTECFPVRVVNFNKKRQKYYVSYRFNTRSIFKKERQMFFLQKNKR